MNELTSYNSTSSVLNIIKEYVNKRLTSAQLDRGWLSSKEVGFLLGCSERTLIRWRSQQNKGQKGIGIICFHYLGGYKYPIQSIYQYFLNNLVA